MKKNKEKNVSDGESEETITDMSVLMVLAYFTVSKLGNRQMCIEVASREDSDALRDALAVGDEASGFRFFSSYREVLKKGQRFIVVELSRNATEFLQSDYVRGLMDASGVEEMWEEIQRLGVCSVGCDDFDADATTETGARK